MFAGVTVMGELGLADVLLLVLLAVCIFFALRYWKRHKNRCSGCGGDCANCIKANEVKHENSSVDAK